MKSSFKSGLIFGVGMAIVLIIEELIRHRNLSTADILETVATSLIAGIISGILFGWFIKKFTTSKFLINTTSVELNPGETVIIQSLASHFKGIEAVGGKLYLTDKRIIFKSHKLNIQNHELIIQIPDILKVTKFKSLGLIITGFVIHTSYQKPQKFAVENPTQWFSKLF